MVVLKNEFGLLCLETLKSAVSQEWIDEMSWFFTCWYKFRKAKSCFNNYWMGVVKNGQGLIDYGTLKSGVSHKWFDELSRFIEWFLHVDSDGIIFVLMANLLCNFDIWMLGDCCSFIWPESLQKVIFGQKSPQNKAFSLFWKILLLIFGGNVL